jgi:hypothetical protein
LQEQGGKTKSCEIEALRAGGGQAPGTLHHVIIRGIERKEIVKDDHDRHNFVYRMGTIALETGTLVKDVSYVSEDFFEFGIHLIPNLSRT